MQSILSPVYTGLKRCNKVDRVEFNFVASVHGALEVRCHEAVSQCHRKIEISAQISAATLHVIVNALYEATQAQS